ncbi:hypothetical protein NEOLEDRAFT_1141342 [Neolentinus lepideus HHB14362 ss-1]|uniref:Uncharacterized protein n=1 Tax=Neolentinus lepideus HHB14362 ss-1 TaxID=1314782 RepID=A0A165NRW1_9AGAM|nr:hypothetical protein NEOLEDRAFT_1141342 [Neolentinus lepideus HHB14362 ss-1]
MSKDVRHPAHADRWSLIDETSVYNYGAVFALPVCEEVIILLVVHLSEIAHEERKWSKKVPQRR